MQTNDRQITTEALRGLIGGGEITVSVKREGGGFSCPLQTDDERIAFAAALLPPNTAPLERGRVERLINLADAAKQWEEAISGTNDAAYHAAKERYQAALDVIQPGDHEPLPEGP